MENTNTTIENKQQSNTQKDNWMSSLAGALFWFILICKALMLLHNIEDRAFTEFLVFGILPAASVLGYFGLKQELKASASHSNEQCSTQNKDG